MDRSTQAALIRRILDLKEQRATDLAPAPLRVPAGEYVDAAQHEVERRVLFREGPVLAGLSAEAPRPGDWFTIEIDGIPLVFVRQDDGTVAGMVNACRHRGAQLTGGECSGQGVRAFVCPYHAWTYTPDGRLKGQPGSRGGFEGLDPAGLGLHRVPVAERYGLIYCRPGGGTEPIDVDETLSGLATDLAGYHLERYTHYETRRSTWQVNWKMPIDTFLEAYHIVTLHKRTIAPDYFSDLAVFDAFGVNGRFLGVRKSAGDLAEVPPAEWHLFPHATIQYTLVPNALLVHQLDHVELWRVLPRGVGQAEVLTSLFCAAPPDERAARHWSKNLDVLLGITNHEDFPQIEEIYRGLASGAVPELVFGRNEPALVHFHESLEKLRSL